MGEQGGYSGPQLFERTVALVKKYRKTLDDGAQRPLDPASAPTQETNASDGGSSNQATAQSDQRHLQDSKKEAEPLIRLPERNDPFSKTSAPNTTAFPPFTQPGQLPQMQSNTSSQPSLIPPFSPALQAEAAEAPKRKVIFASGGITNERQVQEVLAAGSSVALLYTALVYGGVGTISSIKGELEEEMKRAGEDHGVKQTK